MRALIDRSAAGSADFTASLTLSGQVMGAPNIDTGNVTGSGKNIFATNESIFVNGTGYSPSTAYDVYVVNDTMWTDTMAIPDRVSGTVNSITSDYSGTVTAAIVWTPPLTPGKYDVVVDVNGNGRYDAGTDVLDDGDIEVTAGFQVIPEFQLILIVPILIMATLWALGTIKRKNIVCREKRPMSNHLTLRRRYIS